MESQHSMFGIRVAAKVVCSRPRPATRTEGQESRVEGRGSTGLIGCSRHELTTRRARPPVSPNMMLRHMRPGTDVPAGVTYVWRLPRRARLPGPPRTRQLTRDNVRP